MTPTCSPACTGTEFPQDLGALREFTYALAPGDVVRVVVMRELSSAEINRFADALTDGTDLDLAEDVAEGKSIFVVSPVEDVAAFAKTITVGKVTEVDLETRTITVDVAEKREGE